MVQCGSCGNKWGKVKNSTKLSSKGGFKTCLVQQNIQKPRKTAPKKKEKSIYTA